MEVHSHCYLPAPCLFFRCRFGPERRARPAAKASASTSPCRHGSSRTQTLPEVSYSALVFFMFNTCLYNISTHTFYISGGVTLWCFECHTLQRLFHNLSSYLACQFPENSEHTYTHSPTHRHTDTPTSARRL